MMRRRELITLLGGAAAWPLEPRAPQSAFPSIGVPHPETFINSRRPLDAFLRVTSGPPCALAAKAATRTIPILFLIGVDPVQLGLVTSLARPGGNLTSFAAILSEAAGKQWCWCTNWCPPPRQSPCCSTRPTPETSET